MQEASNKVQEVEEQLRNLKQELEIIRYMQLLLITLNRLVELMISTH